MILDDFAGKEKCYRDVVAHEQLSIRGSLRLGHTYLATTTRVCFAFWVACDPELFGVRSNVRSTGVVIDEPFRWCCPTHGSIGETQER